MAALGPKGGLTGSRRMYNTKKRKPVMQTSTAWMAVRGETYKKGCKVKMPKGLHVWPSNNKPHPVGSKH